MTEPLRSAHDGGDDITINPTIDRVLSRRAQALADDDGFVDRSDYDGEPLDREERAAASLHSTAYVDAVLNGGRR